MSVHKECGADIVWLRRDDDESRFLPPMEYAGEVYIKGENGTAQRVHGYRQHLCDPDAIIAWQDYQRRLAEAKGEEYTPYDAARERERENMWDLALAVTCRRCHSTPGEKCYSQQVRLVKAGIKEETRNPHPERIEDAIAAKDIR
jgi:hypothetical protein